MYVLYIFIVIFVYIKFKISSIVTDNFFLNFIENIYDVQNEYLNFNIQYFSDIIVYSWYMYILCIYIYICYVYREKTGVRSGDLLMSFNSIFQDVRSAVDWMHIHVILYNLDLF